MRISDMVRDRREITLVVLGEDVHITFRPSAYTPIVEDQVQRFFESARPGNGLARMLSSVLIDWDVLDDNNKPIEITEENLRQLPMEFLTSVSNALAEENRVSREERKNSGGGSLRKG